ncbi:MAG: methyltransferase domain-containing protein [Gammaproteobacteria bacterium]|jgi:ubiquinone/menaquinone biosynthesis C-methylase UbiE|nr:methyltransferase domain-containing protein [Gammaproteobacteria bacterium]MBP6050417.1 methyltransferase domain-containing protein [Pseudomonadales bacterium]MBK7522003.1 methyltransferase domain-containing protein [Gammaproteobacteria bacterium]MBK7727523.1 methyltransferase domain-containing protein [Gammaproteobacteria bacterium]MBK8309291.1 methyltransferase domain-containing protein [Gammaproteobacteria bacterium]
MDEATARKWDRAAQSFDLMNGVGSEKRWGPVKRAMFARMQGEVLFLAVGTGLDIALFPPGQHITGIDISTEMLKRAEPRAQAYPGHMSVQRQDVLELDFADERFDQVFTSCTFCSVPRPVDGLRQLLRVLKPGGELHMFEHTGSKVFPFRQVMDWMTYLTRNFGPDMNRDTVANVEAAGFLIERVRNVYLDVVKTIHARKPDATARQGNPR